MNLHFSACLPVGMLIDICIVTFFSPNITRSHMSWPFWGICLTKVMGQVKSMIHESIMQGRSCLIPRIVLYTNWKFICRPRMPSIEDTREDLERFFSCLESRTPLQLYVIVISGS